MTLPMPDAAKANSGPALCPQAKALSISNDPVGCAAERLLRQGDEPGARRRAARGSLVAGVGPWGTGPHSERGQSAAASRHGIATHSAWEGASGGAPGSELGFPAEPLAGIIAAAMNSVCL